MDMKSKSGPTPLETASSDAPEYPHGLRIYLTEKELEKLMLPKDPELDDELKIKGLVKVVELSKDDVVNGKDGKRMVLQITDFELDSNKTDSDKFYGE